MSGWVPVVSVATPIILGVLSTVGVVWGKRLQRRTDAAAAAKLTAEAQSVEVATARSLLEDVRELYAEQRTQHREDIVAVRGELAAVKEAHRVELDQVKEQHRDTHHRLMTLIGQLARHRPWDEAAYEALVAVTPAYPPPPPIDVHAEESWSR